MPLRTRGNYYHRLSALGGIVISASPHLGGLPSVPVCPFWGDCHQCPSALREIITSASPHLGATPPLPSLGMSPCAEMHAQKPGAALSNLHAQCRTRLPRSDMPFPPPLGSTDCDRATSGVRGPFFCGVWGSRPNRRPDRGKRLFFRNEIARRPFSRLGRFQKFFPVNLRLFFMRFWHNGPPKTHARTKSWGPALYA